MTKAMPPRIDQMIKELPGWMRHAACRALDPELFFGPDLGWGRISEPATERVAREMQAKQVCAACPVRDACLEYAMATPEHDGLWGGLTAAERFRRRTARPTAIAV